MSTEIAWIKLLYFAVGALWSIALILGLESIGLIRIGRKQDGDTP